MKKNFNPWPLGIVAAFVVFIAGMATAIVIACTHSDSLVARDYYEQELKFQGRIDSAVRASQAGAIIRQDADGNIVIQIPAAHLSQTLAGEIELYRPSSPELDRQFALKPDANGVQSVNASQLAAGSWVMRVKWNVRGESYYLEQKIKI